MFASVKFLIAFVLTSAVALICNLYVLLVCLSVMCIFVSFPKGDIAIVTRVKVLDFYFCENN